MMVLNEIGNFEPWVQPEYGTDAKDEDVIPPPGYFIIPKNEALKLGDVPFDVYSGWLKPDKIPAEPEKCLYPNLKYTNIAISEGRWTTWARPSVKK